MSRLSIGGVGRATVIFGALLAFPFVFGEHWVVNIGVFTLMYAALATAWNLLGGYAGYLSLGHAAFFGVGAYAIGVVFTHVGIGAGYRPFLVLPLVGLGVAVVSVPIAWVALRVRAATFAIVTISLLFIVQQLAFNLRGLTHGSQGLAIPVARFPVDTFERPFYLAMLAILALAVFVCWYVRDSKLGLMLFAIRDDEDRVRGLGVQVTAAKVVAFALSVGITAMAGGVWAYYLSFIYPQFAVDPLVTIGAVLMAFLGGKGTLWGPMLGAFILVPTQQYLAYRLGASQLYLVGYAAVFLTIMLVLPRGILPSLRDRLDQRAARRGAPPSVGTEVPGRAPQVLA
ncbi:MAG: branched-chain amino acid transport system permease protein [Solirubrobacteraceae bacterium]|nr:branched-chain amino acid transport system permease protein [Solirubrobacteraceae bacterium]